MLKPITSLATSRYIKSSGCHHFSSYFATIPPLGISAASESSHASSWKPYLHPEGQLYFQRQFSNYAVVASESNLHRHDTENRVYSWLKSIDDIISEQHIEVPPSSELFIELSDSLSSCSYYFVNHNTKRLFWLEQTSTELLDIGKVVSPSHVDMVLQWLYWVHVELFPAHICAQVSPHVVDDLISIMSHGAADRLTSPSSTFPYTAEKCSQLLQLLSLRRGQPLDGPTLCFVARLWSAIAHQRFLTYYGQECAQFDRLQTVAPQEDDQHAGVNNIASPDLWTQYLSEHHDVFTNDQYFIDQWQTAMAALFQDDTQQWFGYSQFFGGGEGTASHLHGVMDAQQWFGHLFEEEETASHLLIEDVGILPSWDGTSPDVHADDVADENPYVESEY